MREPWRRVAGLATLLCALTLFGSVAPAREQVHITISGGSPNQGDCPPEGKADCGDPIDIATGNTYLRVTDYTTAGPNTLAFTRSYNSQGSFNGLTGPQWTTNFDRYLIPSKAGFVAYRPDGKVLDFTRIGFSNMFAAESDLDMRLTQLSTSYVLTDPSDTVETYGPNGCGSTSLLSIQARNGYKQTIGYDNNCNRSSVTDSYGRILSFSYGSRPCFQLASVTTPDDTVISYGYSSTTCALTTVTYSTTPATTRTYLYENTALPFALTGVVDENGNRSTWTYDSYGRATSTQNAGGANLTQIGFNSDGSRTVTNPLGEQEVYKFDTASYPIPKLVEIDRLPIGSIPAASRKFTYDSNGYLASQTDWNGHLTTFVNDVHGQPTSITEAAGTPAARTTMISYTSNFRLPAQNVAPGLTTTYTYDANGNLLTQSEADTTGNTGQTRTWTYAWSNFLLASVTNPRGFAIQFGHDASGALTSVTNALGQMAQITSHTGGGLPLTAVDPNGVVVTLTYDARQRLLSSSVATGAGPLTTSYAYDFAGNLVKKTLADGSAITYGYDPANRLTTLTDLFNQKISYTLDPLGNPIETLVLDSAGNTVRQHNAAYDALGRLVQDTGGADQTTLYAYDSNGNPVEVTDPLLRNSLRAYDALNRPTSITDTNGGTIAIAYDKQNNPVQITDQNGHSTQYVYDGFNELLQQTSPDTGTTTFAYDADGNPSQVTYAGGAVMQLGYDRLDRQVAATYPGDSGENVAYAYDQSGSGFGINHLTEIDDNGAGAGPLASSVKYAYDERGNLLSQTRSRGGVSLMTSYAYDAANRVRRITYPSHAVADYTRDEMGRITGLSVTPPGASTPVTVASGVTYLPFGPVSGLVFGNGVGETRAFDLDYRLMAQTETGAKLTRNLGYLYDKADNIQSLTDNIFGNQSFGYDRLNRLVGAAGPYGTLGYGYDPVGNLRSLTTAAGTDTLNYSALSNQLMSITSGSNLVRQFTYGATGNLASDQQATQRISLAYNQANRLSTVSVQPSGGSLANYLYLYDGFGRRLAKDQTGTGGSLTVYQYDPQGHLLEETDLTSGVPNPLIDYLYLGDRPVALLSPSSGALSFLQGDRLDTPQAATNAQQNPVWAASYSPLGAVTTLIGKVPQHLRFPGQYADQESGYYHNGVRDYDPSLGRYVESDPIGLLGGMNTYLYALANPGRIIDPDGRGGPPKNLQDAARRFGQMLDRGLDSLLPDYGTGSFDFSFPNPLGPGNIGFGRYSTADRYGNSYSGIADNVSSSPGVSINFKIGYLRDPKNLFRIPCQDQLKNFLPGWSVGAGGSYVGPYGVGGSGGVSANGGGVSVEPGVAFGTPGASGGASYGNGTGNGNIYDNSTWPGLPNGGNGVR